MSEAILTIGARVQAVDEEGHVTLFAYSGHVVGGSITVNVPSSDAKAWAHRIGDFVTISVLSEKLERKM